MKVLNGKLFMAERNRKTKKRGYVNHDEPRVALIDKTLGITPEKYDNAAIILLDYKEVYKKDTFSAYTGIIADISDTPNADISYEEFVEFYKIHINDIKSGCKVNGVCVSYNVGQSTDIHNGLMEPKLAVGWAIGNDILVHLNGGETVIIRFSDLPVGILYRVNQYDIPYPRQYTKKLDYYQPVLIGTGNPRQKSKVSAYYNITGAKTFIFESVKNNKPQFIGAQIYYALGYCEEDPIVNHIEHCVVNCGDSVNKDLLTGQLNLKYQVCSETEDIFDVLVSEQELLQTVDEINESEIANAIKEKIILVGYCDGIRVAIINNRKCADFINLLEEDKKKIIEFINELNIDGKERLDEVFREYCKITRTGKELYKFHKRYWIAEYVFMFNANEEQKSNEN